MLELHYGPGTCSFVVHAGLEVVRAAIGQDFATQAVRLHKGEQLSPAHLALNPLGQVPVLVVDGRPLTQVVAIADYLDRRFPQVGLLPAEPWERAQALSQLVFMNNTAHPAFAHVFKPHLYAADESVHAELRRFNTQRFREHLQRIEAWAAQATPFWFGEQPSFHDAYALTLLRWGGYAGIDPDSLPLLWAHVQRVAASAPVAAAMAREKLELNTYRQAA